MNDQDLIQLLHEKSASDFSPEELDALRARWTQSPELRQALVEHLQLETQLVGALGKVELDVDTILKRAAEQKRLTPASSFASWRWSIGLCLLLLGVMGGVVFFSRRDAQQQLVQPDPARSTKADSDTASSTNGEMNAAATDQQADIPADAAVAAANGESKPKTDEAPGDAAATPPAKPAAVEPAVEPWAAALARDVAPWPANSPKLTRDFKASGHDELSEAEAKRWFAQVEGQHYAWAQDVYGQQHKRVARFQGLARWKAPWPEDALVRLTPFDATDLTLYFWRGPNGIALRFYTRREPHLWAAFSIARETSSPKPLRWGLLTTDNGSYVRSGLGTINLRYQDGGIMLARGDVPLLTAPMASRPDEVFIEGQFRLRGVSIHKSAPLPSVSANPHSLVIGGTPSELPWALSAETPAELATNPDGSATFKSDSRDKLGTVVLPLAERGLYEVIARVEAADPGTGLFLGDADGRPVHRVGFFKDAPSGLMTFGVLRPGEVRDTSQFDVNAFPPPYHTPAQWIKVVAGLGTMQILVSGDGRHWGHLVENPSRDQPGAVGSVGLYGLPGPTARSLKLSHLEVRELTGVTSLADNRLIGLSPRFTNDELKDTIRWTHRVIDTRPSGREIDLPRWFTACAVAALRQGPPKEFGLPLLRRLVGIGIGSEAPIDRKLQLLDDAALLCDFWEETSARLLADHYSSLAVQLESSGDPHPLATIRPAILRSPMWTVSKLRFAWERPQSREVILAAYRADWGDAWQTSHAASFWNMAAHPDFKPGERGDDLEKHARWLRALAVENSPQLDDGNTGVTPGSWRHPLAMQWNKEAYNVRSELQSALVGQTYDDACRIVMSIGEQDGPGLLPDMDDRQLFVSLPTAVAGAMKSHPDFANLMVEKFGPLGLIRLRRAIQAGDVHAVQAATLQFFGTEAAVEAHQWLGDRDLSAGRFASAEEHFLLALAQASPRQREPLDSRLQLAMILNGQKPAASATPPTKPIELSATTITPAEFDALVRDLSARPSPASRFATSAALPVTPPAPAAYRLEARANFDGQPGNNPGRNEYRFGDPFGRQLCAVSDGQRMYVSNRFQVNGYALPGGQQQWAQGLGSEQGEAYAMPFRPMQPLVAGDRLFVRRLTKGGTELACLKCDDGNVVWHQRPNLHVLSDPVFWNGSLFALTLAKVEDDLVQIEGTRFDWETGAVTSSQPLYRLKDVNDRSLGAQLSLSGRLAICTLAGTTACFDGSGEVHWLRRHLWIPHTVDELAEDFRVLAPVVLGDRIVVSVPGVRAVSCLELETGRQVWERPLADLRGVLGVNGSRVLVETTAGLAALSLNDGRVVWTRPLEIRLEAFHVDDRAAVAAQRVKSPSGKTKPYLIWLDLESGRELAQSQVEGTERDENQLGPLLFAAGKWWTFAGQGWKDPKRELNELVAVAPLAPGSFADMALGAWQPDVPESQLSDVGLVLPGWSAVVNYSKPRLQLSTADTRGETFVLTARFDDLSELRLLGEFDVPAGKRTTLRLRFGNQPDKRWSLTVRADNQTLLEQTVEDAGSNNGWRDATVDLTPFAGRRVPLQLIHAPAKPNPSEALWKRAAIVVE